MNTLTGGWKMTITNDPAPAVHARAFAGYFGA